jgi:ferredoxin
MSTNTEALFEAFLHQYDDRAWSETIAVLLSSIHEVDRTATQIWHSFFPVWLARAMEHADDPDALARKLVLQGNYSLSDQIDTSHSFLYGHRWWADVKQAVVEFATAAGGPTSLDLVTQIRDVANRVAKRIDVDASLLVGITAVAFMTLQQVGLAAFRATSGIVTMDSKVARRSPEDVLETRARDDRQEFFYWLKHPDKIWTVTFNENDETATFKLINTQQLTTAAASDKRPHYLRDPRCTPNEGPIPVQCRSASCGTCWVGVLGGAEKLSPVAEFERRRIREFGYIDSDEPKPIIRLACQAQAFGAVSIVIPPWCGVFGKYLRQQMNTASETREPHEIA